MIDSESNHTVGVFSVWLDFFFHYSNTFFASHNFGGFWNRIKTQKSFKKINSPLNQVNSLKSFFFTYRMNFVFAYRCVCNSWRINLWSMWFHMLCSFYLFDRVKTRYHWNAFQCKIYLLLYGRIIDSSMKVSLELFLRKEWFRVSDQNPMNQRMECIEIFLLKFWHTYIE